MTLITKMCKCCCEQLHSAYSNVVAVKPCTSAIFVSRMHYSSPTSIYSFKKFFWLAIARHKAKMVRKEGAREEKQGKKGQKGGKGINGTETTRAATSKFQTMFSPLTAMRINVG